MDQVQIAIDGDVTGWRHRCNEKIQKLKEIQFPTEQYQSSHPMLLQEELFTDGEFISYELCEAVKNGNADDFVNILEQVSTKKKLSLSTIFDQVTPKSCSLLHLAAYFGTENIAELIAQHFPKLLLKANMKGHTALHTAARAKNANVMKIILAQYDAENKKSSTEKDVMKLSEEKVEVLTRMKSMCGNTALHEAVESNDFDVVACLYDADEFVSHFLNKLGKSPLYLAVLASDNRILNLLLQAPFQKSEPLPRSHGNSPLHAAIRKRNSDLIEEILEKRSELMYLKDEKGGTPLHYAASIGYLRGVQTLFKKSTSSTLAWNTKGNFPIHLACKKGHVKIVKELLQLEGFTSLYLVNKKGQNILHIAAKNGQNNVVKYILSKKKVEQLVLNEKDNNGNTPLHLASKHLYPKVLLSLTQDKRIDLHLMNNEGLTALDIVIFLRRVPPALREYLPAAILYSAGAQLSERARSRLRHNKQRPRLDWIKDRSDVLMVCAILIITVTFAAAFTIPGSVYSSDDPDPRKRGTAVLVHKPLFQVFTICNTIAMYSSITGLFLLFFFSGGDFYRVGNFFVFALFMMNLALVTTSVAFMAAVRLVVSNVSWLANVITIIASISLLIILLLFSFGYFPFGFSDHPLMWPVSKFLIRIAIPFAGPNYKVKAKKQEESNSQQMEGKAKEQEESNSQQMDKGKQANLSQMF